MAPKVHAIVWYLENGGKEAVITNPENIGNALKRETGTWFVHDRAKIFSSPKISPAAKIAIPNKQALLSGK
jgi:hypothetical protein